MSVKLKITMWLTALVAVLNIVLVLMSLFVSSYVANQGTVEQLSRTVRSNVAFVEADGKAPVIDRDFVYYHNGVATLVYSRSGSLVAGQIPASFKAEEPFENGVVRKVESGNSSFFVLDIWLPSDWENGVWLRGITEVADNDYMQYYLTHVAAITLPVFTLLAALGSYFIVKGSFRPLDKINAAAEAINEAKDLSGRINLDYSGDEFSRLASNFDDMFARLENSFETEKQFTSDASHELRTPVAIIKSACEYAEKYDETAEDHRETVSIIHRQADRMAVLIQQLLSMTRMEQRTGKINMKELDIAQLAQAVAEEQGWDPARVKLEHTDRITVNADRELMSRLLINLVENALKYAAKDGKIYISVKKQRQEILLSVKDEGPGIAPEHQEKIWNRFYQVDSSRNNEENTGAGLGLPIVRQIAQLHGGYMTLDSAENTGSTFTLHLPDSRL